MWRMTYSAPLDISVVSFSARSSVHSNRAETQNYSLRDDFYKIKLELL